MRKEYQFLIAVAVLGLVLEWWLGFVSINMAGLEASDMATKFFGVVLAALFIERAVEVLMATRFGTEEEQIVQPVREARAMLEFKRAKLDAEVARAVPESQDPAALTLVMNEKENSISDARGEVNNGESDVKEKKAKALSDRSALIESKKAYARVAVCLLGLFAALVGFRVFGQFLPTGEAAKPLIESGQMMWFNLFDVAITTLVLAGGADGLHNTLGQFLTKRDELLDPPG